MKQHDPLIEKTDAVLRELRHLQREGQTLLEGQAEGLDSPGMRERAQRITADIDAAIDKGLDVFNEIKRAAEPEEGADGDTG